MNIVAHKKEPKTLHKNGLVSGCVYTNVRTPDIYYMKVFSTSRSGVVNLRDGSIISIDLTYNEGWVKVEAEVHIK